MPGLFLHTHIPEENFHEKFNNWVTDFSPLALQNAANIWGRHSRLELEEMDKSSGNPEENN